MKGCGIGVPTPLLCVMNRMFKGMQLDDWTKLSGLTHLSLRRVFHVTLPVNVLLRLTMLRSLVVDHGRPNAPGGCCPCCPMTSLHTARRCRIFPPRIARMMMKHTDAHIQCLTSQM
jgi:hypothetical protein